ncbi:TPA: hypothetical protein DF272_02590 [Candidatus Falkowbacteria bacterium]|nr:hypothetical protein [Candidatus Falkowbacteria bacterium]
MLSFIGFLIQLVALFVNLMITVFTLTVSSILLMLELFVGFLVLIFENTVNLAVASIMITACGLILVIMASALMWQTIGLAVTAGWIGTVSIFYYKHRPPEKQKVD